MATMPAGIDRVLAGEVSYDAVGPRSQAVVRATWDERIGERIARLDFTGRLAESGLLWVEADEDGVVVEHEGRPPST